MRGIYPRNQVNHSTKFLRTILRIRPNIKPNPQLPSKYPSAVSIVIICRPLRRSQTSGHIQRQAKYRCCRLHLWLVSLARKLAVEKEPEQLEFYFSWWFLNHVYVFFHAAGALIYFIKSFNEFHAKDAETIIRINPATHSNSINFIRALYVKFDMWCP